MSPIAASYIQEAKRVLEHYAADNEGLDALSGGPMDALQEELLDLQEQFERELAPYLNGDQKELLRSEPFIVEFQFGSETKTYQRGGFF